MLVKLLEEVPSLSVLQLPKPKEGKVEGTDEEHSSAVVKAWDVERYQTEWSQCTELYQLELKHYFVKQKLGLNITKPSASGKGGNLFFFLNNYFKFCKQANQSLFLTNVHKSPEESRQLKKSLRTHRDYWSRVKQ